MAAQGRIILLFLVVLLAGCGQDDTVVDAGAASETSSTTTVAPTTTATVAPTTTIVATTTTSTTASVDPPETTTTVDPGAGHELPGPFTSLDELRALVDASTFIPLDARAVSLWSVATDEEYAESIDAPPEAVMNAAMSATITHFGDLTVWDPDGGHRNVRREGQTMALVRPDKWQDSGSNPLVTSGPFFEWTEFQRSAAECLEYGPEVIGLEQIAGVNTLHLRCAGSDEFSHISHDVWIGEQGHVMKSIYELTSEAVDHMSTWEVVSLDVERPTPLPPGW